MLRKDLINSGAITQQNYLDAQSDLQRLMKLQRLENERDQAKQAPVLLKISRKHVWHKKISVQTQYQQAETELS